MKSDKTTVFVLLDAFRWDYLTKKDCPFLHSLAQKGIWAKKLKTTSGFTQRSAILTGTYGDKTGNYTMYTYDPNNSPFSFLRPFKWLLSLIPHWQLAQLVVRSRIIFPLTKKVATHAPPAWIPFSILPSIGVSEDEKDISHKGAFAVESLPDVVYAHDKTIGFYMFPAVNCDDATVLKKTITDAKKGYDLYLLQFSDSDAQCHIHGSESAIRRKIVAIIDKRIQKLHEVFSQEFKEVKFVIIGDHGMMDCPHLVNVASFVHKNAQKNKLVHGKDYILFLDSTLARIWMHTSRAKQFFQSIKDHDFFKKGTFLTKKLAHNYRIPFSERKYGDLIWQVNPGHLIYPDYFHAPGERVKAMHGYVSSIEHMKGMAVVSGPGIPKKRIQEAVLVDICSTLADCVGVPAPSQSEGKSLLK